MQQRYYDPAVGRFLSVDPVSASAINGGNFNRYWYANNNPYKFTDPDGRLAKPKEVNDFRSICDGKPARCEGEPSANSIPSKQESQPQEGATSGQTNAAAQPALGLNKLQQQAASEFAGGTLDATDIALTVQGMFLPVKEGGFVSGNYAISRYVGASRQQLKNARRLAAIGKGVGVLTIGLSSVDLYEGVQSGDGFATLDASINLGIGAWGMWSPVGAAAAIGWGGTSFLLSFPAVDRQVTQRIVRAACDATGDC